MRGIATSKGVKRCPFCGEKGYVEIFAEQCGLFVNVGCNTPGCRSFIPSQPVAFPFDKVVEIVDQWNARET